jgi:integrase/recombinase XerC
MRSFSAAISLSAPLEQYIAQLEKQRRISNSSLSNYRSDLLLFRNFIADYRITQWADVSDVQARAFIEETKTRQLSVATAKRRFSSLQGFFNHLRRSGVITRDPLLGFKVAADNSATKRVKIAIDTALLHHFIANDFVSQRDKAIVELLLCCEISLVDLLNLELFSIDFSQKSMQFRREKAGDVSIVLTHSAFESIKAWMELRMAVGTFDQSLFISKKGQRISVRTVQLGFARLGKAQGIKSLTAKDLQFLQRKNTVKTRPVTPAFSSDSPRLSQLVKTYQNVEKGSKT